MVNDEIQTTLDIRMNQAVPAVTRQPNKIGASTPFDFDAGCPRSGFPDLGKLEPRRSVNRVSKVFRTLRNPRIQNRDRGTRLATIFISLMVVTMNRLVWRRLYRLAETRYKLEG
ncbi:MAG: hypothetical protein ACLP7O_08490 [Terracidiphilus sp.]